MNLTLQDKNELLKAAFRSDGPNIAAWLVTIVEQYDNNLSDGKQSIPVPPFQAAGTTAGTSNGQAPLIPR